MYFASRLQAGRMLASRLAPKYSSQDCAVIALSDGGVVVGSQIAVAVGGPICLLLSDEITLPREIMTLAGITQDGAFSYNHSFSDGEIDEMVSEYRNNIEQQKMEKMQHMHRAMGEGRLIRSDMLNGRHIILASDGLSSGFALDLAMQYLRPIQVKSLIVAVPFASVQAVDRMHILADDIFCMNVLEDYISADHYYDSQDVPAHDLIVETIEQVVGSWQLPTAGNRAAY